MWEQGEGEAVKTSKRSTGISTAEILTLIMNFEKISTCFFPTRYTKKQPAVDNLEILKKAHRFNT